MKSVNSLSNNQIAEMLRDVAGAYELKGESFFKVRAYNTAADAIEHATSAVKDLWEEGRLDDLPGIGSSIAAYLDELFRTGEVEHFEKIKEGLPKGTFVLMEIPGIGPKTAFKLAKELKIQSVEELREAAEEHRVQQIEGFGEKTEQEILQGIDEHSRKTDRMLLPQAMMLADTILTSLRQVSAVVAADYLGSLRRRVATIGDIDLAVAVKSEADISRVVEAFATLPGVQHVIEQGDAMASVSWVNGKRVDLRVQTEESYGSLLQHFTGSKQHNIHLRTLASKHDLSLSERGIKHETKGASSIKAMRTEEDFYRYLKMPWIPPEMREDTGEIEAALNGQLPRLIHESDIKGDLHLHCDFDLEESHDAGRSTMEDFARRGLELGYEYISLGNHSPSVYNHTKDQMVDLIKRKSDAMAPVQERFPKIQLLNEVEVDILSDGSLAVPDEGLALLDVVVVSIHSSMRQSKEQLTHRVVEALKHPLTHVFGHPTGRLLDSREGYELDWDVVFATAKEHNKAIEINSFYNRLDLPDTFVREAVKGGVKLAIDTDAHHVDQLVLMPYGVSVARRGWATKEDVVNTLPWATFQGFIKRP